MFMHVFMPLGTLPQHDEVALEPRNSRIGSAVLGRRLVKLVPHALKGAEQVRQRAWVDVALAVDPLAPCQQDAEGVAPVEKREKVGQALVRQVLAHLQ